MPTKVKISEMLKHYPLHAVVTNGKASDPPPPHQWGYVMGGDGRVATDAYVKGRAKSSYEKKYGARWTEWYEAYKKWIGRHVIDCNAVAEAFYKLCTGQNIDTKAKYNYSDWCSPKSPTMPDALLAGLPQIPGVALFSASVDDDPSDDYRNISHVGFLLEKYGPGPLDWYVLEARGKDHGLVITRLVDREWRWWGVMSKYFDYDITDAWHSGVIAVTAPTPAAPKASTYAATCGGQGVNVRTGRSTAYDSLGTINKGAPMLALPAVDGWNEVAVEIGGRLVTGYMYAQYVVR